MAQARGLEADEHLAGLGLVQVEVGEFPRLAALAEHRGPVFMGSPCGRAWVWLANNFHITRFSSSKVSYIVSPEPGGALMTSTASASPDTVVDPSSLLTDGAQLIGGQWVPA